MNVKGIIGTIAEASGKRKGDITRSYNAVLKKTNTKFEGTGIPETTIQKVAIFEVAEKYEFSKDKLNIIIDNGDETEGKTEMIGSELPQLPDEDEEVEIMKKPKVPAKGSLSKGKWAEFFSDVPELEEETPSLPIEIGAKFKLKLLDPTTPPYKHTGNGQWGDYISYAVKVTLVDIHPDDIFEETYEKGAMIGKLKYFKDTNYTLWLSPTAIKYLELFFNGEPDDREFVYQRKGSGSGTRYFFKEV